jgi:hypothetical protein
MVAPIIDKHRADLEWIEQRLGGVSLAENLAANDADAVRSEEDLLRFTPESLQWLAEQLGPDFATRVRPGMDGAEVAQCMHALRESLARADPRPKKRRRA